jgi:hypothetical protein
MLKGYGLLQEFWAYVERDADGDEDIISLQENPHIAAIFRTKELADSFVQTARFHASQTGNTVYLTTFKSQGRPI